MAGVWNAVRSFADAESIRLCKSSTLLPYLVPFDVMHSKHVDQIAKASFRPSSDNGRPLLLKSPRFHFRNKCGTYQRP